MALLNRSQVLSELSAQSLEKKNETDMAMIYIIQVSSGICTRCDSTYNPVE